MIACLFTAQTSRAQIQMTRGTRGLTFPAPYYWRAYEEAIVYGSDTARAQRAFESWITTPSEAENPAKVAIEKTFSLPVHAQILTETSFAPIDWPQLHEQVRTTVSDEVENDFEQGNWLDLATIESVVAAARDIENLQQELPADISTGLNWSSAKQFFFSLNVLKVPPPPVYDSETNLPMEPKAKPVLDYTPAENPDGDADAGAETDDLVLPELPPLPDRATTLILRARNSAVAFWLWRKNSAALKLASNPIHLRPIFPIFNGDI